MPEILDNHPQQPSEIPKTLPEAAQAVETKESKADPKALAGITWFQPKRLTEFKSREIHPLLWNEQKKTLVWNLEWFRSIKLPPKGLKELRLPNSIVIGKNGIIGDMKNISFIGHEDEEGEALKKVDLQSLFGSDPNVLFTKKFIEKKVVKVKRKSTPVEVPQQLPKEPLQQAVAKEAKETKYDEFSDEALQAPVALQRIHFQYDLQDPQAAPGSQALVDEIAKQTGQRFNKGYHLELPAADYHELGFGLDTPELVQHDLTGMKFSEQRLTLPDGTKLNKRYIHADGSESTNNSLREKEHQKIRELNEKDLLKYKQRAAEGGDGSSNTLYDTDSNISPVIFNEKTERLEWNLQWFQMMWTAYDDAYAVVIPTKIVLRIRGALHPETNKPSGLSCVTNQAEKDGELIRGAKKLFVQKKTNPAAEPIVKVNLQTLLDIDPNELFKIKLLADTNKGKDHKKVVLILNESAQIGDGCQSTIGAKAYSAAVDKFAKSALDENNNVPYETIEKTQKSITTLVRILGSYLKNDLGLKPTGNAFSNSAIAFNKLLMKKVAEEKRLSEAKTPVPADQSIRTLLIKAVTEWLLTEEYEEGALVRKARPAEFLEYVSPKSSEYKINMKFVEKFVDGLISKEKTQFSDFLRTFFDLETTGGYMLKKFVGLTSDKLNQFQALGSLQSFFNLVKGKKPSCLVLGGDPQDLSTVKAVCIAESESSTLPKTRYYTLKENEQSKQFKGRPSEWVKQQVLNDPKFKGTEFGIRFRNEIYYVYKPNGGLIRLLPEAGFNEKTYKNFMDKFNEAAKEDKFFSLSPKGEDKKILDDMADKMGVPAKGSKDNVFSDTIREKIGLQKPGASVQALLKYGTFQPPRDTVQADPAPQNTTQFVSVR